MADVKLMVMYPRPQDVETFDHLYQDEDVAAGDGLSSEYARSFETFEKLYQEEHVPMIFEKLVGKTRFVATKVVGTSNGTRPPFYRIAEVHFPSLQALRACAQSDGGRETLAHAVKISSGGAPLFLVAEETTFLFGTVSLWDWLKGIASSGYASVRGARAPKRNRIALLSIASKLRGRYTNIKRLSDAH